MYACIINIFNILGMVLYVMAYLKFNLNKNEEKRIRF